MYLRDRRSEKLATLQDIEATFVLALSPYSREQQVGRSCRVHLGGADRFKEVDAKAGAKRL